MNRSIDETKQLLQSILDGSLDIIQVLKAVRDESGAITDFYWQMNNRKAIAQNGDVIGKSALKKNPGMVESGIFHQMIKVVETGIPYQAEQYYSAEQFNGRWFYLTIVKQDDGVVMTTRDITAQKKTEQHLLEQNHFIKAVTNIMPDAVSVVELPSRNIVYLNRDPMLAQGFDLDEISLMSFAERAALFHADDLPGIQAFYSRFASLKDNEENRVEYRLKNKAGGWTCLSGFLQADLVFPTLLCV